MTSPAGTWHRPDAASVAAFSQAALAIGLLVALIAWRDPDPALRWSMPVIGAVGLTVVALARRTPCGPWLMIALDFWFLLFGVMLSMSVAGDMASVSGQYDPHPDDVAHLIRLESWLDPLVHRPVAATFLVFGAIGVVAAARSRSAPR